MQLATRLRGGVALGVLGLITGLAPVAPALAAAPTVLDEPITLEKGHIDAFNLILNEDESVRLTLKEDDTGTHVLRTPESVELYVKPTALTSVPAGFVPGLAGDVYYLPLTQDHDKGLIWPGWDSLSLTGTYGTASAADIDIKITEVDGPGEVFLWTSGAFGGAAQLLTEGWKFPGTIHQSYLAHVHANWAFTAPGTYKFTVHAKATSPDDTMTSTTQTATYTFVVAERTKVTPQAPTQDGNVVTIPNQKWVDYSDAAGNPLAPGALTLTEGLAVNARAAYGFDLAEGMVSSWAFEYEAPTPTVEPTPTPTPTVKPSPTPAPTAPVASVKPAISGTPAVGNTVTAKPGTWSVAGLSYAYQWLRNGTAISGATKAGYTIVSADAGKDLTVQVTASRSGLPSGTAVSAAVRAGKKLTATPTPKITGTGKVGKTLKAKAGTWKPAKVTAKYQWLRDGQPITKATTSSYKLVKADAGRKITVRVTGSKSGYVSVAKTSKATSVAKVKAKAKLSLPSKAAKGKQATAKLTVTAPVKNPTGTVKVTVNGKTVTAKLTATGKGKISVKLPAIKKKGSYKVRATFTPDGATKTSASKSSTVSKTLKVR